MILNLEQRKRLVQRQAEYKESVRVAKQENAEDKLLVSYKEINKEGDLVHIMLPASQFNQSHVVPDFNLGQSSGSACCSVSLYNI